ncbi:MAG: DNA-binding protein WhiA, partial [Oscillospiraceae bacterium]
KHNLSQGLTALLKGHDFLPGNIVRKGSNIIYFKASEQIEDLLTFMGASGAALEIMNLKVYKDFRNKANRITNCETANIDKMVEANGQTLSAIKYLKQQGAYETMPENLREAAKLREENPEISLKELAACFNPPLSKSGLCHRLRRISEIANALSERNKNV